METIEIGLTRVEYSPDGTVATAEFLPTLAVNYDANLLSQLRAIKPNGDEATLRANAELVFGAWFAKVTAIELADRDVQYIKTETVRCERYPDGAIKLCVLKFVLAPVPRPV